MNKAETLKFMQKIKAYYPNFSTTDFVKDEWIEKLSLFNKEDIYKKFEEHLYGDYALEPPKLHFITKYLRTEEQKLKEEANDMTIQCNLCGEWISLSDYNNEHYRKCLLIKTLIPFLTKKGEKVSYKSLNEYDYKTLEKVYDKYIPLEEVITFKGEQIKW